MRIKTHLAGGFKHFLFFHNIWDVILPIDELYHFSRWVEKPPTSHRYSHIFPHIPIDIPIDNPKRYSHGDSGSTRGSQRIGR